MVETTEAGTDHVETTPIEEAIASARSLVGLWQLNATSQGIHAAIADLADALSTVNLATLRSASRDSEPDLECLECGGRIGLRSTSRDSEAPPLPDWACGSLGLCHLVKGHDGEHTTSVDRAAELDASHGYLVFEGPNGEQMRAPYRALPSRDSENKVYAVAYSNYSPAEIDSLWARREDAEAYCETLGGAWAVEEWTLR